MPSSLEGVRFFHDMVVPLEGWAAARYTVKRVAAIEVESGGRSVRVSSPERVVFPAVGLTKGDLARYYAGVGEVMLTHLDQRPTTLERYPEGLAGEAFYSKRMPKGAPEWVESARIAFPSGRPADEVCPTEPAVLVWAAQMGTVTFHPWPVRRHDTDYPDELRIDLDPQPGTDFADAVAVALVARSVLDDLGWVGFIKTSGGRGLHVYVRLAPRWDFIEVRHAAIAFGRELERRAPSLVTTAWWKEERGARIFIDYNQNARDRTIASPYSVRAHPTAPVSTPLDWNEVVPDLDPLAFTPSSVLARIDQHGDAWAAIDEVAHDLTPLLQWWGRDVADGLGELSYPPDYPKMPGEPPRVQPSRARH